MAGPLSGYYQINRYIYTLIATAKKEDDMIPLTTERELCELFQMSHGTVRKALQTLTDEGVLIRRPHYGTYINPIHIRNAFHQPMIDLIIGNGNPTYLESMLQEYLAGLFSVTGEKGCLINPVPLIGDPELCIKTELHCRPAAVIWLWLPEDKKNLAEIVLKTGVPLLTVMPRKYCEGACRIDLNYEDYGYELSRILLKKGYSDILYLENCGEENESEKKKGIARAFAEAGVEWSPENFVSGDCGKIWNSLREKLLSEKIQVINSSGVFHGFQSFFPKRQFIIPCASKHGESENGLPSVTVPIREMGKRTGEKVWNHLKNPLENSMNDELFPIQVS